jgi:hypothetical protein
MRGLQVEGAWPEVFGDLQAVEADLTRIDAEARYRRDAWSFIRECVTTVDELDPETPIKPFPVGVCVRCQRYLGHPDRQRCPRCGQPGQPLGYLEHLARQWQTGEPALLVVPKARRMRLTWLFVALHVWLAWSRPKANVFFVSSKEEKSAELVERARGILARLPTDRVVPFKVHHKNSPPEIRLLGNGAKIWGISEGADQLRQYTATAILADEFGHWEWPRNAFTAMRPCIDGGGRLTILSSAYPGFYRELVAGEALG